jgi:hypothetical protein
MVLKNLLYINIFIKIEINTGFTMYKDGMRIAILEKNNSGTTPASIIIVKVLSTVYFSNLKKKSYVCLI